MEIAVGSIRQHPFVAVEIVAFVLVGDTGLAVVAAFVPAEDTGLAVAAKMVHFADSKQVAQPFVAVSSLDHQPEPRLRLRELCGHYSGAARCKARSG